MFVENQLEKNIKSYSNKILKSIKQALMDLPKGDKAMLFGSQARGDVRVDGILERELIQKIYTTKKWTASCITPFFYIEQEGILLAKS